MNRSLQTLKYIIWDVLAAAASWTLFFAYRKYNIDALRLGKRPDELFDANFKWSIFLVPLFWLLSYYITGSYNNVYRRSRINEIVQTFVTSIIGVIVIFFIALLDDFVSGYREYYKLFFVLFSLHFGLTMIGRFILSSITNNRIHKRQIGFNTVVIGSNERALKVFEEISSLKDSPGNLFVGFIHLEGKNGFSQQLQKVLPHLGEYKDCASIIREHGVEEVIIAIESWEHDYLGRIINELSDLGVIIKIIPDMYDILSGQVKMNSILGAPLIEVNRQIMPDWQMAVKRFMDVSISLVVLVCFFWLYLLLIIIVKTGSKGPAFFRQSRIGIHGKPFRIYKFRTMYEDAEKNGPALSSATDSRITKAGRFLRRVRLDELPQFYNVLKGDMSLVGPRPERQYYIDRIVAQAPHYKHLHKVRPGITSWGQVKYGYAENVDQMVSRLKFDLLYIENMSLLLDVKILVHTVLIVMQGRGK